MKFDHASGGSLIEQRKSKGQFLSGIVVNCGLRWHQTRKTGGLGK
jgi:hypothetical protein